MPEKRKGGLKSDLTGEWMSSSRSTEQRSHCSNVSARCMIFLTIFSRSVCSSNRSFTTSSRALRNNSNSSKCIQITQAFKQIIQYFKPWDLRIVNKLTKSSNTLSETARSLEADFESVWKTEFYSATFLQVLTHPAPLILLAGFGEEFGVGNGYSTEW